MRHDGAPEMAPVILAARDIDVVLGGQPILRQVGVGLRAGEVTALVGPNGAGKSTLLAALAGDIEPQAGIVEVDGHDLNDHRVGHLALRRAVQVQEARLSFAFTVIEVVRMGREPWRGTEHAQRDERVVAHALGLTEMTAMAHRRFPTLSGGEKSRVAFSRVVAQETAALLLDEPTAALDIRHQEAVLGHVRDRAAAGVAVVVVLHDLSLAAAYADRIVLLADGRVRAEGAPRDVMTPELLGEVYRHPVSVIDAPEAGGLLITPVRTSRRTSLAQGTR